MKEEDNIGSVKYITGKQYEQNVVKASEERDVLFAITTDWCQYCGKITDIIYEISWENVEGLTVAQMDGDRNEAKDLKVEAFPTLYLYSKGKPVEEYPGVWEAEKVRAWLSQHSQAFAKHQLKKMDEAAAKQEL